MPVSRRILPILLLIVLFPLSKGFGVVAPFQFVDAWIDSYCVNYRVYDSFNSKWQADTTCQSSPGPWNLKTHSGVVAWQNGGYAWFSVFDPVVSAWQIDDNGRWSSGNSPAYLKNSDGVVAWVLNRDVEMCVYDPVIRRWVHNYNSNGCTDTTPTYFQNKDGVVAFMNCRDVEFHTYDPETHSWVYDDNGAGGTGNVFKNLITSDRVVAWIYEGSLVEFSIYDPVRKRWVNKNYHTNNEEPAGLSIYDGTVFFYLGDRQIIQGYNHEAGYWFDGPTKPLAYFTPTYQWSSGQYNWVQFQNSSLGANYYSWSFGDGTYSTEKSPQHRYNAPGTYAVVLTVTGPGGVHTYIQNVTTQEPGPRGSVLINNGAAETSSPEVILNLDTAESNTSKCRVRISDDNTPWTSWNSYTGSVDWKFSGGPGLKNVSVQFRDKYGLTSPVYSDSIMYVVQSNPPSGSININNGDVNTTSRDVTLNLSVNGVNGPFQMRISDDDQLWTSWMPYQDAYSWTFSIGTGTKSAFVQFKNNSGAISPVYRDSISYSDAPQPVSITVTYPSGGEHLPMGSYLPVTYDLENVDDYIFIDLYKGNQLVRQVQTYGAKGRWFDWQVPNDLEPGNDYRIRIYNNLLEDYSDGYFSIDPPSSTPYVKILSSIGGKNYKMGSFIDFYYSSNNLSGSMYTYLCQSGQEVKLLAGGGGNITSRGQQSVTIPPDLLAHTNYQLKISCNGYSDISEKFAIVGSQSSYPMTLTFPSDEGIELEKGQIYKITWDYFLSSGDIFIELFKDEKYYKRIVTTGLLNKTYSWYVPDDLPPGDSYRIRIRQGEFGDLSDFKFKVLAPYTPNQPDFNGDGQTDLIWRLYGGNGGKNVIWFMDNDAIQSNEFTPREDDLEWKIAGTGDFNNDGKSDILWRHYGDGRNQVWFMDGATRLGTASLMELTDMDWIIVGTGDFNADGNVDIVWRKHTNGKNVVWFMNGVTRTGSSYLDIETDPNWHIEAVADFNRDGKPDLLWRSYDSLGEVRVWYMDGITMTGSASLTSVANHDWKIEAVGDFNDDKKYDIVWRNYGNGKNVIWFMNGHELLDNKFIQEVGNLDWDIENH